MSSTRDDGGPSGAESVLVCSAGDEELALGRRRGCERVRTEHRFIGLSFRRPCATDRLAGRTVPRRGGRELAGTDADRRLASSPLPVVFSPIRGRLHRAVKPSSVEQSHTCMHISSQETSLASQTKRPQGNPKSKAAASSFPSGLAKRDLLVLLVGLHEGLLSLRLLLVVLLNALREAGLLGGLLGRVVDHRSGRSAGRGDDLRGVDLGELQRVREVTGTRKERKEASVVK